MVDDFEPEPRRRPTWQQLVVWALVIGLVLSMAGAALTLVI